MIYNPKPDLLYLKESFDELDKRVSKLEKVIPILLDAQKLIQEYMKGDKK